jgi:formylglycine-generating enzyme required for sulfatase activity
MRNRRDQRLATAVTDLVAGITILVVTGCWNGPAASSQGSRNVARTSQPPQARDIITIPGGSYQVGCSEFPKCSDNPTRSVHIASFRIDRIQVLHTSYAQCEKIGTCAPGFHIAIGEDDPAEVAIVSFRGAEAYCRWRGGHVPTSVEWEVAGRGPSAYYFPWGNSWTEADVPERGRNKYADMEKVYAKAGTRPDLRSAFGVEDMSGNVPAFVQGVDGPETRGAPNDRHQGDATREDYSLVTRHPASARASFRCAY